MHVILIFSWKPISDEPAIKKHFFGVQDDWVTEIKEVQEEKHALCKAEAAHVGRLPFRKKCMDSTTRTFLLRLQCGRFYGALF